MEQQQVAEAEASLTVEVKMEVQVEPEPQSVDSPTDDASKSKKKKKKKKNRRNSLEKTPSEVEDIQDEEDNQNEEASIEDTTVTGTEESTVETEKSTVKSTVETFVSEENTVESTVAAESTIEKDSVEINHEEEHENGDDLAPPSLERTSSLDLMKATGTKAVGSLFSRFKVGRKKPLPSRTESAAKLEGVVPSPVKTAVEKFQEPEEKNLDDLPMRTKRDFFGEGEQSIHVSAEKEKYDTLEKQRKTEKEAEEAAIAARRTPPSSTRSNEEVQAQLEGAKEQIEATTSSVVESSTETVEVTDNADADANIEVTVDEVEPSTEVLREDAPVSLESTESEAEQVTTTEVEEDITVTSVIESATTDLAEADQHSADATTIEPVSLKLDLDLEPRNDTTEAAVEEVVAESTETLADDTARKPSVEAVVSTEGVQSEGFSTNNTELLTLKVTPPTSELLAEAAAPTKPEKMSPVKSLASRFEGKREQSLDSLKFRTVREFFPTERSIRVGAEKQKYEAQAQQQQLKAKAEEEAKSKYKTVSGFKSPIKESASSAPSPELKATTSGIEKAAVVESPLSTPAITTAAESTEFTTPDTASSRKKFSFDDGYASANSPSKFSDEALTPVKSIASRFEGKREQSLDSLKFRTVREFFPEERSVRVGSEKQKLEAQAQQDNSLDKLKFRTVREFFPDEGKRSVQVGAEKAKFEALTKQQEEAAKAAEQIKQKHAAPSQTPTNDEIDSSEISPSVDATIEASLSSHDESHDEGLTSAAATAPEPKDSVVTDRIKDTIAAEADIAEGLTATSDSKAAASVEVVLAVTEENNSPAVDAEIAIGKSEDTPAVTDLQSQVNDAKGAQPAVSDDIIVSEETKDQQPEENLLSTEEAEIVHEAEKAVVGVEDFRGSLDLGDAALEKQGEPADAGIDEEPALNEQINTEANRMEKNQETSQNMEATVDNGLVDLDFEAPVVDAQTESNASADLVASEEVNVAGAEKSQESVEAVEETAATSALVELSLDETVGETQIESSATAGSESAIASAEVNDLDIQQPAETQETVKTILSEVKESTLSVDNGLVELDLGAPAAEVPKEQSNQEPKSKRPMLTTERSFVIEDDQTIETEDTVVVGERPMTDGEDEFEPLSPSKARPAHELFAGITSHKSKELNKKTSVPKLTRRVSAGSVGSAKSPKLTRKVSVGSVGSAKSPSAKTTVPVPMKRASITAPTASYMANKAAEAEQLHKSSPQLKKQGSASKLKGTASETGFIKPAPAAPTVPLPMKRASITAPTASYMARKAAEEAHRASPQPKQNHSATKRKGSVSETGFIKPPPAAPTVPVPMKRASITAPTTSWQARNVSGQSADPGAADTSSKNHASKSKAAGKQTSPSPASIMAPTASYMAKKAAENAEEVVDIAAPSAPARNKRYSNVKSKVFEGFQSGSTNTVTHKKITKEEFIAAERRKSLGSAGVRSVLDVVDRRASLTARVTIDGPPEPFVRPALSRKKLNLTVPRYMNYENTPGYAERAQKQYERRKRLEEENAAKSEKRQRELRTFFADKQQKSLMSSADEVRRGLEAHEFAKLAKESEIEAQKALRREKQRERSTRRAASATSSIGASSSNCVTSRTSKKSSVSSTSTEKVTLAPAVESSVVETEEVQESTTVVTEETVEVAQEEVVTEEQEVVIEAIQVEEQTIPGHIVDDDPALEHVAKKIDFDEASSDSDEKDFSNE